MGVPTVAPGFGSGSVEQRPSKDKAKTRNFCFMDWQALPYSEEAVIDDDDDSHSYEPQSC